MDNQGFLALQKQNCHPGNRKPHIPSQQHAEAFIFNGRVKIGHRRFQDTITGRIVQRDREPAGSLKKGQFFLGTGKGNSYAVLSRQQRADRDLPDGIGQLLVRHGPVSIAIRRFGQHPIRKQGEGAGAVAPHFFKEHEIIFFREPQAAGHSVSYSGFRQQVGKKSTDMAAGDGRLLHGQGNGQLKSILRFHPMFIILI